MRRPIATVALLMGCLLLTKPASAQAVGCPTLGACAFTATSTPQAITLVTPKRYQRITNAGTASLWCSRVAGATPAPNAAGSFEIRAGGAEEYPIAGAGYVPPGATVCVSASGNVPGSAEVN